MATVGERITALMRRLGRDSERFVSVMAAIWRPRRRENCPWPLTCLLRLLLSPIPLTRIRACPFDLVARAELAIQGCTRLTNRERGGQPYSYAELHTDPPIALHSPWDYADVCGSCSMR